MEDKDGNIWKPDGKGMKGLEEEQDYVMRGKVSKQWQGQASVDKLR